MPELVDRQTDRQVESDRPSVEADSHTHHPSLLPTHPQTILSYLCPVPSRPILTTNQLCTPHLSIPILSYPYLLLSYPSPTLSRCVGFAHWLSGGALHASACLRACLPACLPVHPMHQSSRRPTCLLPSTHRGAQGTAAIGNARDDGSAVLEAGSLHRHSERRPGGRRRPHPAPLALSARRLPQERPWRLSDFGTQLPGSRT
jgi:hypothetical protein